MKLITNEYTKLIDTTGKEITIKPNVPFEPMVGEYTITAYAIVRNAETGEIVAVLEPGKRSEPIGKVAEKPKSKRKKPQTQD